MHSSRLIAQRHYALTEVPPLAAALALAELVFRFHSFTLELLAFLGTWWLLRLLMRSLTGSADRTP